MVVYSPYVAMRVGNNRNLRDDRNTHELCLHGYGFRLWGRFDKGRDKMTVEELRDLLDQFPDDMNVLYWYDSAPRGDIETARIVREYDGKKAVVLHENDEISCIRRNQGEEE